MQKINIILLIMLMLISCKDTSGIRATSKINFPELVVADIYPFSTLEEAINASEYSTVGEGESYENAITVAFAVKEIISHFDMIGHSVSFLQEKEYKLPLPHLYLKISDTLDSELITEGEWQKKEYQKLSTQGYYLAKSDESVQIYAPAKQGVLYGVYRLLESEGFAWYDHREVTLPTESVGNYEVMEDPKTVNRGFWIFNEEPLPRDYLLWLARNRFNLTGPGNYILKNTLGIKTWGGGHQILQEIYSEEGLYEKHPEWFALVNGERKKIPRAGTYYNPAFSNAESAEYFSKRLIERLADGGDLNEIDILNIWPEDSRVNLFDQSDDALSTGNNTDNLLLFYLRVQEHLDVAFKNQLLDRKVVVAGISYFNTWIAPTRLDLLDNLALSDYIHIFYLNERTWSKPIFESLDEHQSNNTIYKNILEWDKQSDNNYGTVDYYNYSAFAALAITDHLNIEDSFLQLSKFNKNLVAYMHPLYENPGPRRLTNQLFSKMLWKNMDPSYSRKLVGDAVKHKYFSKRYGKYAMEWESIYDEVMHSIDNAKELFGEDSLNYHLFKTIFWGESREISDIEIFNQFKTGGLQSIPLLFEDNVLIENFRGLDESLSRLNNAASKWRTMLAKNIEPSIKARMLDDVEWFESSLVRYRLTSNSVDLVINGLLGNDNEQLKSLITNDILLLESSKVTNDTLSPVNQRNFLNWHKALLTNNGAIFRISQHEK
ncbi:hypothetical protein ACUR5C_06650 [Aliikangiella sp. IMCC44653]